MININYDDDLAGVRVVSLGDGSIRAVPYSERTCAASDCDIPAAFRLDFCSGHLALALRETPSVVAAMADVMADWMVRSATDSDGGDVNAWIDGLDNERQTAAHALPVIATALGIEPEEFIAAVAATED